MGAIGREAVSRCLSDLLVITWICVVMYNEGFPFYPLLKM